MTAEPIAPSLSLSALAGGGVHVFQVPPAEWDALPWPEVVRKSRAEIKWKRFFVGSVEICAYRGL